MQRTTRLVTAAVLATLSALVPAGPAAAHSCSATHLYGWTINPAEELELFRLPLSGHASGTGTFGTAQRLGIWDTNQFFVGGTGVLYAIANDGTLWWYRYDSAGRLLRYARVGSGWNNFETVFAQSDGVIYGIDWNGILWWYRHLGYRDGTASWALGGAGKQVGSGWGSLQGVWDPFGGGNGVIYVEMVTGELRWFRDNGYLTGAADWEKFGDKDYRSVGSGWDQPTSVTSLGAGIIYATNHPQPDKIRWWRHLGFGDGSARWTAANPYGSGWLTVRWIGGDPQSCRP